MSKSDATRADCKRLLLRECNGINCVCCIEPTPETGTCYYDANCVERGGQCMSSAVNTSSCIERDASLCNRDQGCSCCIMVKQTVNSNATDKTAIEAEKAKKAIQTFRASWNSSTGGFKPNKIQQLFLNNLTDQLVEHLKTNSGIQKRAFWQRKEYRQLSKSQRKALHAAFEKMMVTKVSPGMTQYQFMVTLHQYSSAPGAHNRPSFLPWHRIFLLVVELILKSHDPTVSLAYWDSSLDDLLPNARDSILFSRKFLGTTSSLVTYGDFAYWPIITSCQIPGSTLTRGSWPSNSLLYDDVTINRYCSASSYSGLLATGIEGHHGGPHVFVGGHMNIISCSPSDPVFFMHHAFTDLLWEDWQNQCQTTPWWDYPLAYFPCGLWDQMQPFSVPNIYGMLPLSSLWGYNYAPRPTQCTKDADCDAYRLWCYYGRCTAKVKVGGSCATYSIGSTSPCECGQCNASYRCQIVTLAQAIACMAV